MEGDNIEIYGLHITNWNTGIWGTGNDGVIGAIGKGNRIDFANNDGIRLNQVTGTVIQNNIIQETSFGIQLVNGDELSIGGNIAAQGNIISENNFGILLDNSSTNNAILSNSIYCNVHTGIDNSAIGNNSQAVTEIVIVSENQIAGIANPFDFIQVFREDDTGCEGVACQGKELLYNTSSDANGKWSIPVSLLENTNITATATDLNNNTSEFSDCQTSIKALNFLANDVQTPENEDVCVEVNVEGFKDIFTMQYSIHWDASVLQYNEIVNEAIVINNADIGTAQVDEGILTIAWLGPNDGTTLTDNETIYKICFTPVGLSGASSAITFESTPSVIEVMQKDEIEMMPNFEAGSVTLGAALATDLLAFDVYPDYPNIGIKWQIVNEIDLVGFELQRSENGRDFQKITYLESGKSVYTYLDQYVNTHTRYYYRLKMLHQDGTSEYSPIRSAELEKPDNFELYPNPTNDKLTLKMPADVESEGQLFIFNNLGQTVWQQSFRAEAKTLELQVQNLPTGVYFLQIQLPKQQWETKFIKE